MLLFQSLFAIISNTFTETLRQPVHYVVIFATILILIFSPSLAMFTMDDDNLLLKDVGLSTLLVAGLFLSVFASTSVLTDEIENKTVLTVLSKTVSRPLFVIGKFIGIASAILLAQYLLSLVLIMITRFGVLQRASDDPDYVVVVLGVGGLAASFIIALAGNYFYKWRFTSVAIILKTVLATLIIIVLYHIDKEGHYEPSPQNIQLDLIGPMALMIMASMILTAVAVAASIRFNLFATLFICICVFLLGATLQYLLGPIAAQPGIAHYFAWAALAIVPSINIFVVTNAIYNEAGIPLDYIAQSALYALLYISAILMFAIALFRRREIG
ncbi:MAG: hypothetical protein K9M57_02455 [Phycisphaerae bacterium]|nr:hypothetical protein [Phycisphaerae bacterium]